MNRTRSQTWLRDERAVEVAPRFAPRVGDPVPRRLNYIAGRTLTEQALQTEQTWRDRRFALLGRALEPGIVEGLEVEVLDDGAGTATLRVLPGTGLASSGEDIALGRSLTARLDDVPPAEPLIENGLLPRGLVVLLLQPVRGLTALAADPEDPCPADTEVYPYADIVTLDGARLVWSRLDGDPSVELAEEALLARPVPPEGGGEPRLLGPLSSRNVLLPPRPLIGRTDSLLVPQTIARNTTAQRLIDQEADAARLGQEAPWARFGLPLAVAQIDAAGGILFVDRFAVARTGGAPRQAVPSAGIGLPPVLRRARFDQFVDHLQDLRAEGAALAPAILHFRVLPPIGVLPATLLDFETMRSGFFPSTYRVEAAPIPQLEAALGGRSSLEPFDLARGDYVQILVPVPEHLYEPRLLLQDLPAEEIVRAVELSTIIEAAKRSLVLGYEGMEASVIGAIDLARVSDPAPPPTVVQPSARHFEDEVREMVAALHQEVEGLPVGADDLEAIALGSFEETIAALNAGGDRGGLVFRGLKPAVDSLTARLDKANDFIDLSFVRLQADIYRARQNLVGDEDKSRLATSPVLANLATSVTGIEASQKINELFLDGEKRRAPVPATALQVPQLTTGGANTGTGGGGGAFGQVFNVINPGLLAFQPTTFNFAAAASNIAVQAQTLSSITSTLSSNAPLLNTTSLTAATIGSEFTRFKVDLAQSRFQSNSIAWQGLVFGKASPVRTVTLAERLRPSPAQEAKNAAVVTKAEIARGMQDLGLNLAGLQIPLSGRRTALVDKALFDQVVSGLPDSVKAVVTNPGAAPVAGDVVVINLEHLEKSAASLTQGEDAEVEAVVKAVAAVTANLLMLRADLDLENLAGMILADRLDPDPPDADEGAFYAAAVDALESAVSMLRLIESRIHDYAGFLDRARDTLLRLYDLSETWQGTIDAARADLAEAVHDKTVASALLEEETERVEAINRRRADILEKNVEIIAFARPHSLDRFADSPGMDLFAPLIDPIPACLEGGNPPARELQDMVDNLREVPVGWFPSLAAEIDRINRPNYLIDAWFQARDRAQLWLDRAPEHTGKFGTVTNQTRVAGKAATGIHLALLASTTQITDFVAVRASRSLEDIAFLSWRNLRELVSTELSIDDLKGAGPSGAEVNRKGLRELGQILSVAACLLAVLRETPTVTRLRWAETLSVHDDLPDLADITRAVGWTSLPFEQRRTLEHMHRWLFARIDGGIDEARRAMSEIVRVCLLLSSHAPVSEIVEGQPVETRALVTQEAFEVAIGKGQAAIGMIASFAGAKPGLGVITDIIGPKALVQITYAPEGQVAITPADAVRFTAPVHLQSISRI